MPAFQQWLRQSKDSDGIMATEIVGEAIVRCLEVPLGAAYDFVELRPNTPMPKPGG